MQRRARSFEATRAVLHGVREVSLQANLMSLRAAVVAAVTGSSEQSAMATAAAGLAHTTRELARSVAVGVSQSEPFPRHLPQLVQLRQLIDRMQCLAVPVDAAMPGLRNVDETSCLSETAPRHIVSGRD
jgi:hypothetical protein